MSPSLLICIINEVLLQFQLMRNPILYDVFIKDFYPSVLHNCKLLSKVGFHHFLKFIAFFFWNSPHENMDKQTSLAIFVTWKNHDPCKLARVDVYSIRLVMLRWYLFVAFFCSRIRFFGTQHTEKAMDEKNRSVTVHKDDRGETFVHLSSFCGVDLTNLSWRSL